MPYKVHLITFEFRPGVKLPITLCMSSTEPFLGDLFQVVKVNRTQVRYAAITVVKQTGLWGKHSWEWDSAPSMSTPFVVSGTTIPFIILKVSVLNKKKQNKTRQSMSDNITLL